MATLGESSVARHVTSSEKLRDAPSGDDLVTARLGAIALLLLGGLGLWCLCQGERLGLDTPAPGRENVFFRLYALHERPFFWMEIFFGAVVLAWLAKSAPFKGSRPYANGLGVLLVGATGVLAVVLLTRIGTHTILRDTPLSMDEYEGVFQARIFAAGHLTARVPDEWNRFAGALTPIWIVYLPESRSWIQSYLPVYAAIRAGFRRVSAEEWTGPMLAGFSLAFAALIGRRLWPDRVWPALLAAAFLGFSTQFLLMSMTSYPWPAHLVLNLVWLWLYLSNRRSSFILLPFIGVLALGVHYPVTHALFVAPFLVRAIRRKRRWVVYWLSVYALGSLVWWRWLEIVHPYSREGGFGRFFGVPVGSEWLTQLMNVTLIFSWQTPILAVLCLVAVRRFRELHPVLRDLTVGILITLLAHLFVPRSQGHGWGFRYVYGVLGNLALLGTAGAVFLARAAPRRTLAVVLCSLALSLGFQIPLRAVQAASFVRPFARAFEYLASSSFSVILIDDRIGWYAQDLVRNGPFLGDEPKLMSFRYLPPQGHEALRRRFDAGVHFLTPEELRNLGIPAWRSCSR